MTFSKGDLVLFHDEFYDEDVVGTVIQVYESSMEPVDAFEIVPTGADYSVVAFENELTLIV